MQAHIDTTQMSQLVVCFNSEVTPQYHEPPDMDLFISKQNAETNDSVCVADVLSGSGESYSMPALA